MNVGYVSNDVGTTGSVCDVINRLVIMSDKIKWRVLINVASALTVVHAASENVNCLHMYSTNGFLRVCNSADFIWSSLSDPMLAKHESVAYTEKCATKLYLCAEINWRGMPHENQKRGFFLYDDIKTECDSFLCSPYLSCSVANNTALCIIFIYFVS